MSIQETVILPLYGKSVVLQPAGEFQNDFGQVVKYKESVKVQVAGRTEKFSPEAVAALMEAHKKYPVFRTYLDSIPDPLAAFAESSTAGLSRTKEPK